MAGSPDRSPLRQDEAREPPPLKPASSHISPQNTISGRKERPLAKALGFPLRSLLREPEVPIPPRESPAESSNLRSLEISKVKEKENSLSLPKRETPFPASPLRSPFRGAENTIPPASPPLPQSQNENSTKSPARDGGIAVTHLRSFLEDAGSPISEPERSPEKPVVANRMAAPSAPSAAAKVGGSGGGRGMRVEPGVFRQPALSRAEVGLRVSEVVLCLVSFSVMAANKTSGWAGDSFDRYQEYRYCLSMNVIAFVYAGFQVYQQFHHRIKGRHIINRPFGYYFDFFMDQVLAYLLMSASSSAATRNDVWVSMFGRDKFTDKMSGSIAVSFLAFFAFAISSVISAYKLFSWNP